MLKPLDRLLIVVPQELSDYIVQYLLTPCYHVDLYRDSAIAALQTIVLMNANPADVAHFGFIQRTSVTCISPHKDEELPIFSGECAFEMRRGDAVQAER
jgi:hypothetical protein